MLASLAVTSACDRSDAGPSPAFALEAQIAGPDSATAARLARFGHRAGRPDTLRALYLNAWAVGSRNRMEEHLRVARETEINAFVLDIKESDSYLTHTGTQIPLVREIGADGRPASRWLPELVDRLNDKGIYTIARIVVFKDEMLATEREDLAIQHVDGGVWRDRSNAPWVNPYNRTVWDYNIDIAREALEMGFSELQWDYVRFPDVPARMFATMHFPGAGDVAKDDIIRDFVAYSRDELAEFEVSITADVFGLVTHVRGDMGIGQQWEKLSAVSDVLLPMVYPSHYYAGSYGFSRPNSKPYEVVRISMEEARLRNELMRENGEHAAEIVPWLQAFSAPWVDDIRYGATHLREQIQATYDAGLTGWVLWHPGSQYSRYYAGFRGANGEPSEIERDGWEATRWDPPAGQLSPVIAERERERRASQTRLDSIAVPEPSVRSGAPDAPSRSQP